MSSGRSSTEVPSGKKDPVFFPEPEGIFYIDGWANGSSSCVGLVQGESFPIERVVAQKEGLSTHLSSTPWPFFQLLGALGVSVLGMK